MDLSAEVERLRAHLGRQSVELDKATAAPLRNLALAFDREEPPPADGEEVPVGWHLAYFLPTIPRAQLGPDGLAADTGVLPAMPLPRRVQAGSRIAFQEPIFVGDQIRRETEFSDIQLKVTANGTFVFAVLSRRIYTIRGLSVTDDRQYFFREAAQPGSATVVPKRGAPPGDLPWRREYSPDPVTLFRFSAATMATHRIHYDYPYATQVEGYPNLVVHGTFSQQCLLDLVRDNVPGRQVASLSMRARAPLFAGAPFSVVGRPSPSGADLWAVTPEGTIAIEATVTFAEDGA